LWKIYCVCIYIYFLGLKLSLYLGFDGWTDTELSPVVFVCYV